MCISEDSNSKPGLAGERTRVWVAFPSYQKIAFGSTGLGSNPTQCPPIHVGIQQHHRTPGRENLSHLATPPLATRRCRRSLPSSSRRRRQADQPQRRGAPPPNPPPPPFPPSPSPPPPHPLPIPIFLARVRWWRRRRLLLPRRLRFGNYRCLPPLPPPLSSSLPSCRVTFMLMSYPRSTMRKFLAVGLLIQGFIHHCRYIQSHW
jgi:hypothetical protein